MHESWEQMNQLSIISEMVDEMLAKFIVITLKGDAVWKIIPQSYGTREWRVVKSISGAVDTGVAEVIV